MRPRTRLIKGLRLSLDHVRVGRDGILLVHGNSSSKDAFSRQITALTQIGLSVVVPDLPGHGASERSKMPQRTYSFPGYAEVLHGLMVELGYDAYHVFGWSLGGHIGLEMLSRYAAVRSLLLTGTPPVSLDPAGIAAGFNWTPSTALAGKRHFSNDDVVRYVGAMMGSRRPSAAQLRAATATDGNARFWMVRNGMSGVGVDEVRTVSSDSRPLAIVQGIEDPFINIGYLLDLSYRNIWGGAPIVVDGGHAPHWQSPAIFNGYMQAFLKSVN